MKFCVMQKTMFIHTDIIGNVARMAGIGEGTGPLSVEVPVERVRQFVYQVGSLHEMLFVIFLGSL